MYIPQTRYVQGQPSEGSEEIITSGQVPRGHAWYLRLQYYPDLTDCIAWNDYLILWLSSNLPMGFTSMWVVAWH